MTLARRATGPGRVNLIGDHTDYNRGLALPIAIDLGTTVEFTPTGSPGVTFFSTLHREGITLPVEVPADPEVLSALEPPWARLVGAVMSMVRPETGGVCRIMSSLPVGSGLSSSAALATALARVFGATGSSITVARLCQRAENLSGVPVGMMDPLVCAGGRAGNASLIDFSILSVGYVPIPESAEIVVVDSGQPRALRDSGYADRVAECEAAATTIGPLGLAEESDVSRLRDPLLQRRARHVVSECRRVRQVAEALKSDHLWAAGAYMTESHRSLAEDFDVSTPALDALADHLRSIDGVYGARMTGAGFGGSVVALSRVGAIDVDDLPTPAWKVTASDGAAR
ncbi:MAG TPA: galactokinase family protein [Acidimicrobiales bacterium]|jgi:galactokinase|nr:galactokinase family protein [Acidimicrobiales bacterium]